MLDGSPLRFNLWNSFAFKWPATAFFFSRFNVTGTNNLKNQICKKATVLCATDSVASVAIVKEEAYPKLNSIMFGESVINDAVSIIIFQTVKGMMSMGKDGTEVVDLSGSNIAKGIGIFFYVTICSILLGTGFGLIISAILKNIKSLRHNAVFEVTLIMLFGYMSYIIAEISDLSGTIKNLIQ